MPQKDSRLVYSTDGGRVREVLTPHNRKVDGSGKVRSGSAAPPGAPPNDGVVRVQRDKRGRGGKTATTITGLPGTEDDLDALLKVLKQTCGAGGKREGRVLIVQGDQRERLMEKLTALGHKPKLAGG
jgi:translation initiation factor 1